MKKLISLPISVYCIGIFIAGFNHLAAAQNQIETNTSLNAEALSIAKVVFSKKWLNDNNSFFIKCLGGYDQYSIFLEWRRYYQY